MRITSRMPRAEYDKIDALNISRLKEMRRSPQHYRYALSHPKRTESLVLGNACHVATLEPERYELDFVVWDRTTSTGSMAPRRGQHWEAFVKGSHGRTILTPEGNRLASAIASAVRSDSRAMVYLASGDPEVTFEWTLDDALGSRPARGRVDWLTTIDERPYLVGLKTARSCQHFAFGSQAAKLAYYWQWAFYHDGYKSITEKTPQTVEIVVEVEPPHAVAVYRVPEDIIDQGREEYWEAVKRLNDCERSNYWPGPQETEEFISLPSWVYGEADDLTDIGLETGDSADELTTESGHG